MTSFVIRKYILVNNFHFRFAILETVSIFNEQKLTGLFIFTSINTCMHLLIWLFKLLILVNRGYLPLFRLNTVYHFKFRQKKDLVQTKLETEPDRTTNTLWSPLKIRTPEITAEAVCLFSYIYVDSRLSIIPSPSRFSLAPLHLHTLIPSPSHFHLRKFAFSNLCPRGKSAKVQVALTKLHIL